MGVGPIISDTFGIVKTRFGPLLGLWAIYFAITVVVFIALAIAIGAAGTASLATMAAGDSVTANGAMAGGAAIVLVMIVFYVGYLLVAMAQYASLIWMASPAERPSFGDALSAGWRAAPALLLLMVILIIGYIGVALVFSLLGAVVAAMGDAGSAVLALVLLPVLVWIGCRLIPLFAVVAVDQVRNPFAAIGRSWRLTRGHALTIFLASLVFLLIVVLVCGVALLPAIGMLRGMANPAELASGPAIGGILLLMAGGLVANVLFNLLYCAFMAVVHGTLTSAVGEGTAETFA